MFILFLVLLIISSVYTLNVKLPPHAVECFYQKVEAENVKLLFQFNVPSGGFLDIDATVTGPGGELIHKFERETESKITFNAEKKGTYSFCFSNEMSTLTNKIVNFNIHVGDLMDPMLDKHQLENIDPIELHLLRLNEGLHMIEQQQQTLRTREKEHRDLAELSNSRVVWWSVFEILMIIGIAVVQVYYLKKKFAGN